MILKKGDKVRIKKDSIYDYQIDGIGRIKETDGGWAFVDFKNEGEKICCNNDLELVRGLKEPKIFIFRK